MAYQIQEPYQSAGSLMLETKSAVTLWTARQEVHSRLNPILGQAPVDIESDHW